MQQILSEIENEYKQAAGRYPPFHSTHEGYAVIKEEMDELWDLVKTNKKLNGDGLMHKECIQIAAMAVRFIKDLCQTL